MKLSVLLYLLMGFHYMGFSQSIAPQSVNSAGKKMSQPNGSISFIVGDLVILSESDGTGNSLGNAFTAGTSVSTVNIQEPAADVLNVTVHPNPTAAFVHIDIKDASIEKVLVYITDENGKEMYSGTYTCISNTIGVNAEHYPTGTYFLTLKGTNHHTLGVYKIIKQ